MICLRIKFVVCEEAPQAQITEVLVALARHEDVIVRERAQHLLFRFVDQLKERLGEGFASAAHCDDRVMPIIARRTFQSVCPSVVCSEVRFQQAPKPVERGCVAKGIDRWGEIWSRLFCTRCTCNQIVGLDRGTLS